MNADTTTFLTPDQYQNLLRQAQQEPDFVLLGGTGTEGNPGRFQLFSAQAEATVAIDPASHSWGTSAQLAEHLSVRMRPYDMDPDSRSHPFPGGWVGYVAYEFGYLRESRLAPLFRGTPCPVFYAGLFLWVACLDRQTGEHSLYVHPRCAAGTRGCIGRWRQMPVSHRENRSPWAMTSRFKAQQSAHDFRQGVRRIKAYIDAGDCYQTNLSQAFTGQYRGDPWPAFDALSRAHPTPFSCYLKVRGDAILSLSPERFLSIRDGRVLTSPIKGTRARGQTPEQDEALLDELQSSVKDKAENLMIVDLLRNDLGRHCQTGTVRVPGLFEVESYRNVHHLVSHVEGRLKPEISPFEAFLDAFPGGSITGAPKIRAMEIIRELEPHWRGPYCGSVFYWGLNGNLDSSIAIRTLLCDSRSTVWCWGGGGIVADSDPQAEYEETLTKVRPLMSFLESL